MQNISSLSKMAFQLIKQKSDCNNETALMNCGYKLQGQWHIWGGNKNWTKEQGGETWNAAVFLQCIFQITHRESNEGLIKAPRNERKD